MKEHNQIFKKKQKEALAGAAASGVLKKGKDEEGDGGLVKEEMLNIFEKEFDVAEMTEKTIEKLFLKMGLKPEKLHNL